MFPISGHSRHMELALRLFKLIELHNPNIAYWPIIRLFREQVQAYFYEGLSVFSHFFEFTDFV